MITLILLSSTEKDNVALKTRFYVVLSGLNVDACCLSHCYVLISFIIFMHKKIICSLSQFSVSTNIFINQLLVFSLKARTRIAHHKFPDQKLRFTI